jgi:protease-4
MQSIVDEAYEDFITVVADQRGMTLEEVRELADGRVYTGIQAAENGLIDGTGTMDDAVDELEELIGETGLSVVEYSVGGFWTSLYEYEQSFLNNLNLLPVEQGVGVRSYYLLAI